MDAITWMDVIKLVVFTVCLVIHRLWGNAKTESVGQKVIAITPTSGQVSNVDTKVQMLQSSLEELTKKVDENAKAVPGMIKNAVDSLEISIASQFQKAETTFAKGQPLSEKTIIEGDKKNVSSK